jgi:hypothetical protein
MGREQRQSFPVPLDRLRHSTYPCLSHAVKIVRQKRVIICKPSAGKVQLARVAGNQFAGHGQRRKDAASGAVGGDEYAQSRQAKSFQVAISFGPDVSVANLLRIYRLSMIGKTIAIISQND